jgi:hypothetical protein
MLTTICATLKRHSQPLRLQISDIETDIAAISLPSPDKAEQSILSAWKRHCGTHMHEAENHVWWGRLGPPLIGSVFTWTPGCLITSTASGEPKPFDKLLGNTQSLGLGGFLLSVVVAVM